MMDQVRDQYERFPYPPVHPFALPHRGQGQSLSYEYGTQLVFGQAVSHRRKRILVAGAGTLEALVVGQAHPFASEIVAVDISEASLNRLKKRILLAKVARFTNRLPSIRIVHADLHRWEPDTEFDYILASNLLHHSPNPGLLLKKLSSWLRQDGIFRVVTYPKTSRIWMRKIGTWLKLNGVNRESLLPHKRALRAVALLPPGHPIRACFESHPESASATGVVDAFMHSCENALTPLEWKEAAEKSELTLCGESHTESSRSTFLQTLWKDQLHDWSTIDRWHKLQIIDDLLELCANPILWFKKDKSQKAATNHRSHFGKEIDSAWGSPSGISRLLTQDTSPMEVFHCLSEDMDCHFELPSSIHWELGDAIKRAQCLLPKTCSLDEILTQLRTQIGPRVNPKFRSGTLPGLSITEYPTADLLGAPEPWQSENWHVLDSLIRDSGSYGTAKIYFNGQKIPGRSLADQAEWLQCSHGPFESRMSVLIKR